MCECLSSSESDDEIKSYTSNELDNERKRHPLDILDDIKSEPYNVSGNVLKNYPFDIPDDETRWKKLAKILASKQANISPHTNSNAKSVTNSKSEESVLSHRRPTKNHSQLKRVRRKLVQIFDSTQARNSPYTNSNAKSDTQSESEDSVSSHRRPKRVHSEDKNEPDNYPFDETLRQMKILSMKQSSCSPDTNSSAESATHSKPEWKVSHRRAKNKHSKRKRTKRDRKLKVKKIPKAQRRKKMKNVLFHIFGSTEKTDTLQKEELDLIFKLGHLTLGKK